MKKYELTTYTKIVAGKKLFRIKAAVSFGNVESGELGGYIENENNLAHDGNAWVSGNACVYGNARVSGDAWVLGDAWVSGNARVSGNAWVDGNACVDGDARVSGNADYATVKGFGSVNRNTTFYKQADGSIGVICGCFSGNLDEFREKVEETHAGTKFAEEYLIIADLMEMHFDDKMEDK